VSSIFRKQFITLSAIATLGACNSSKEAELEKQLEDAQAATAQEAEARQAAEREAAALRNTEQSAELAEFYGSDSDQPGDSAEMSDEDALTYRKAPPQILGPGSN
jgi:hypothetical protein